MRNLVNPQEMNWPKDTLPPTIAKAFIEYARLKNLEKDWSNLKAAKRLTGSPVSEGKAPEGRHKYLAWCEKEGVAPDVAKAGLTNLEENLFRIGKSLDWDPSRISEVSSADLNFYLLYIAKIAIDPRKTAPFEKALKVFLRQFGFVKDDKTRIRSNGEITKEKKEGDHSRGKSLDFVRDGAVKIYVAHKQVGNGGGNQDSEASCEASTIKSFIKACKRREKEGRRTCGLLFVYGGETFKTGKKKGLPGSRLQSLQDAINRSGFDDRIRLVDFNDPDITTSVEAVVEWSINAEKESPRPV